MKRVYLDILLLFGCFLGAWLLFSLLFSNSEPDKTLLSPDKEEEIAQHLHVLVLQEHKPLESEKWQVAVDTVMLRLSKAAGKPKGYFKVQLLEAETQNAFATLGGNIYLFKGMIELAGSPEVLAAVLAHEMAHLQHHDFEHRLSKEVGLTAMMAIFSGGNPQTVAELGKTVFALGYDRKQEQEADAYASKLLAKAAVDPSRLTELFLKLKRTETVAIPEEFNFLLSHPHLKYRIEQASSIRTDSTFTEKPFELEWD